MSIRGSGIAGLACFGLIAIGAIVEPTFGIPATDAPPAEFASYVADHHGDLPPALLAYGLAFGVFLVFAAGVWTLLRRFDEILGATFALAAAAMSALIVAGFVPEAVAAYRRPGAELARTLNDLSFGILAFSAIPTAVATAAFAAVVLRSRCLPAWTAWVATLAAAAHVVLAASFLFHSGFFSLEGQGITWIPATMFAWILATSVALVHADRAGVVVHSRPATRA